jgi:hypothetical protein
MVTRLTIAATVATVLCAFVSTASSRAAQPVAHVNTESSSPSFLFVDAAYSGPPIFDPWHFSHPLTDLGCSFMPLDPSSEAGAAKVTLRTHGWTSGDLYDPNTGEFLGQQDALHARLGGMVVDSAGHQYRIAGTFFDDGSRHVLPGQDYYGIGHVAISGSAGRVVGNAILYRVIEGGDSWSIDFTKVDTCT